MPKGNENTNLIQRLYVINKRIKELKKEENEIKEILKEKAVALPEFEETGKVTIMNGEYAFTLLTAKRESIDTKSLKKDYPSIYEKYRRVTEYLKTSVKKI